MRKNFNLTILLGFILLVLLFVGLVLLKLNKRIERIEDRLQGVDKLDRVVNLVCDHDDKFGNIRFGGCRSYIEGW